jgi:hypothetical protein
MRHIYLLSNIERKYEFLGALGSGDGVNDGILDILEKLYHKYQKGLENCKNQG